MTEQWKLPIGLISSTGGSVPLVGTAPASASRPAGPGTGDGTLARPTSGAGAGAGALIGGPPGAIIGAGLGAWIGDRAARAAETVALNAKKAAAEGPSLDAIPAEEMLAYIESIREIMEFSDDPAEIATMCEQSNIPKALVEIANLNFGQKSKLLRHINALDVDHVVLAHPVRRHVDLLSVDGEVSVHDQLAGVPTGAGEPGAVDDVVQTTFEQLPKGVFVIKMLNNPIAD